METEDQVMMESVGGLKDSCKAAYMLIYTNQFVVSKAKATEPAMSIPVAL